jgi:hypothetical protein
MCDRASDPRDLRPPPPDPASPAFVIMNLALKAPTNLMIIG